MPNTITLTLESESIQYLCKKDKRLAKVISTIGPISYLPYEDGYAFLVHEIIEQMLSVKAGAKIYARLENLCVGEITPDVINGLSDEEIRSIGTSAAKVSYIRSLTQAIASGALDLALLPELDDKSVIKQLTAIKGIGKDVFNFCAGQTRYSPYRGCCFSSSIQMVIQDNRPFSSINYK